MPAHRATILLSAAAAAVSLTFTALPATAQVPEGVVLNIMRECAKIGDATARLACYDNNIRQAGASPSTAQAAPRQGGGPAPAPAPTSTAQGFGSESVRVRETPQQQSAQSANAAREIQARVSSIAPREPGIHLLTLEDGAQWLFAEGVAASYRVPSAGSTVSIERGSLGSFLLRFDGQRAVPVRRIR